MEIPKDQYACAHICVEVDLEAGSLEAIKLTMGNWFHLQKLDYEQLPFKCRGCHEYRHFIRNYPQKLEIQQDKVEGWKTVKRTKTKTKSGKVHRKEGGNNASSETLSKGNIETQNANETGDETNVT